MPPEIVTQIQRHRELLDAFDHQQSLRMARAWQETMRELESAYAALAQEMAERAAQGLPVSRTQILRAERYQSLLVQIAAKQRALEPVIGGQIETAQAALAQLALAHSQDVLDGMAPALVGQFDRLPYDAVANMVGNTGAGTPVGRLLRESWGRNANAVGNALVRGTALGWHPSKTAALMRQAVDMNLTRAMVIARTETLRVYRMATQMQYQAAGMGGYRRVAAKSIRTCLACLMTDGQYFDISVPFQEHVSGRCVAVPARDPRSSPITWETGGDWFERQDAATQREMLGPQRYAAWQAGRFALADLPVLVDNPTWGGAWQVRSFAELSGV